MHPFIIILKPTAVIGGSKGMVHLHWLANTSVVCFLPFVIWNYLSRVEHLYLFWKRFKCLSIFSFNSAHSSVFMTHAFWKPTGKCQIKLLFFYFHSVDFEIAAMVGRRSSTGNKKSPTAAEPALARRPKRNISPKSYVRILTFQLISNWYHLSNFNLLR